MIDPSAFHGTLRDHGLTFFTGVPDSLLKDLCAYITEHSPTRDHVINANEGSAVALAAGYHLATGRIPVVYMQNSGFGNAVNPLLSLASPDVYAIPMLVLVGWRGEPGVPDEPQHVAQGRVMERLLGTLEIPYSILGPETPDPSETLGRIVASIHDDPRPYVLLIRKGTFSPQTLRASQTGNAFTRASAIEVLLAGLPTDAIVVCTTGMTSREVHDYRVRNGASVAGDFLTVGSMGHCSQIALGIAMQKPDRLVVCLDGDGAALMHMGSLAIIGSTVPANLRHVVINNGAHDSVGGQPTAAKQISLADAARACGYRDVQVVAGDADLSRCVRAFTSLSGPSFLEVRVSSDPDATAHRPAASPVESKQAFMRMLLADDD